MELSMHGTFDRNLKEAPADAHLEQRYTGSGLDQPDNLNDQHAI